MALAVKRDQGILLRVSPEEKALIERKATAAGLKRSEFIRRELGIGNFDRAAFQRVDTGRPGTVPENQATVPLQTFDQRVRTASQRMPKRNAERLVKREEAQERAQAALNT